jgi:hypothetical protein
MSNSLSRPVALMFLLVLALPATVLAQTKKDAADLSGVVFDASGRPAAGYPMKMTTSQGDVIIQPTEADGTFGVDGLPPGNYEFRVFEPGGSTDHPIASKKITLAAGQKEKIEIRLGSDNPAGGAASKPAAGTTLGTTGVNWTAVVIPVLVLAAGIVAFFALRSQRRPGE